MEQRFRQIHLDFHLSEAIPAVGDKFDANEFGDTLAKARVNSVTTFARCHHGWMYFDSKRFPERLHPNLKNKNLLLEQIEACHKRDIRVPIYTSVFFDNYSADRHPEWRMIDPDGRLHGGGMQEPHFYKFMCVNSPYRDFLKEHITEILETLPTDGFFIDIVPPEYDCSCHFCVADMKKKGMDISQKSERTKHGGEVIKDFKRDLTALIRGINPDCGIFYNAGHIGPYVRDTMEEYSHFELESVPSAGWGYVHFPLTMRYARNLGPDCLGMTGHFNQLWGDVHSFKNPPALDYECLRMLAMNAKISVGDQLHPSGKICAYTYDLIGGTYAKIEQLEPWCRDAKAVSDIGVFTPEGFSSEQTPAGIAGDIPPAAAGALRMLQEAGHQFEFLDAESVLNAFKLLILPDHITVAPEFARKLEDYVAKGGGLIASFASGMNETRTAFTLDALGVEFTGDAALKIEAQKTRNQVLDCEDFTDYILPEGEIGKGLYPTEHAMYMPAAPIRAKANAKVLSNVVASYFDRTAEHFCSHQQTPSSGDVRQAGIVQNGNCIYFAHPAFTLYQNNAPNWCKRLLLNAVGMLLPEPLLRHDGPTTLFTAINEQPQENRWVLHLLHYIPERRSRDMDVIEDVIPLHDLHVSLLSPNAPKAVRCVPQQTDLPFSMNGGRAEFVLPRLEGHQMIELSF